LLEIFGIFYVWQLICFLAFDSVIGATIHTENGLLMKVKKREMKHTAEVSQHTVETNVHTTASIAAGVASSSHSHAAPQMCPHMSSQQHSSSSSSAPTPMMRPGTDKQ
jgi:hypothetical protein